MELFALKYMTRFTCVGGACPETCCQRWQVTVDKEHYERLRGKMSAPEDRARFDATVRRLPGMVPAHRHALVVLAEDKRCGFLESDGMCMVHRRFGPDLLPDTCAVYPRSLVQVADEPCLAGLASCPEVARQVLFEDDALEIVVFDAPAIWSRVTGTRIDPRKSKDPYEANFLPVRGLLARLLADPGFPVASRLFFVAYFAEKARDLLQRGHKSIDAEGLQELGSSLEERETLVTLQRTFSRALVDQKYGLTVVREMLRIFRTLKTVGIVDLVHEVDAILGPLGAAPTSATPELQRALLTLPPLDPALAARLDVFTGRIALHDIQRLVFVKDAAFIAFFHKLLVRLATFRFIVGTVARAGAVIDVGDFDALARRTFYLLTRAIEHNLPLLKELDTALEEGGMHLEYAISLIRT